MRASALGRQTAIRAELFPASGLILKGRDAEKGGGQVTEGRQMELLKPRPKRGDEDCDARSVQFDKSRKSRDFTDADQTAGDGRARGP